MTRPLVSVIIPTYNRAEKVINAIESVRRQTYQSIQLIVVDDGSADHTAVLLRGMEDILYIYQKNGGQASARNTGLKYATGELVASLDSDDYWDADFLEKCVPALLCHDADFVFANWNQKSVYNGGWQDFLSSDPYLEPFRRHDTNGWYMLDNSDLRKLYLQACPSPSSSTLLKRTSITTAWNRKLNIGDDWGLYLDMILTKPCKALFTMERLWYKDIDGQNIFDGRERAEIVRLLLVEDTKEIMSSYDDKLTEKERKILERQYVGGLVELSKHTLVRERHIAKARQLFSEALSVSVSYSFATMFNLIRFAFNHRYRKVSQWLGVRHEHIVERRTSL